MANVLVTNPMVIDTAGLITKDKITVKAFSWIGTSDGDDLIINDGSDTNEIWSSKLGDVSVTGYETHIGFGREGIAFQGLFVNTIDNGTLKIYVK
jgi:hypothetical protein